MARWLTVFRCPDCGHKWRLERTDRSYQPDCPACGYIPDPIPDRIAAPAIVGTKSRAVDEAYKVVSEDYGLTNLKDNAREGESSVIMPTMGKEMQEVVQAMSSVPQSNVVQQKGGFMWGGAQSAG